MKTHEFVTSDTPIAMLTLGQLQAALQIPISEGIPTQKEEVNEKQYLYGLRGIKELFNVSHPTAQKYKDTFLKPAIIQHGRKIMIDQDLALKLFSEHNK